MYKKFFITAIAITSLIAVTAVIAQSNIGAEVGRQLQAAGNQAGLGIPTDPRIGVARVIKGALSLVGIIFLILILYSGYSWMTAGGNEEKVTKAKKLLVHSSIGLVIILSAYSITLFAIQMAWKQRTRRDLPAGIYTEPRPAGESCPYGDEICNAE